MFVGERSCDEESRQQGDDVGLEALHHKFKERHSDAEGEREWREDLHEEVWIVEHVIATSDEDEKEQVAGEHVRKQPERQGERTNQEEGRDLNWGKENINGLRYAWHERDALEVLAKALLLDSHPVENNEREDGQHVGERDVRHRRELQERHDAEYVIGNNKGKEGEEEWHEAHEVVSDDFFTNVVAHEAVNHLARELEFARHNRGLAR